VARNRASAKAAGSRFERTTADYLAATVDDRIDRRVKTGAKDKGDIAGIRHMGGRVVLEAKDYGGRFLVGPVVAKRRGTTDPGDQVVFMTLRDFAALLTGVRP
jgi:hypothetical protein